MLFKTEEWVVCGYIIEGIILGKKGIMRSNITGNRNTNIKQSFKAIIVSYQILIMVLGDVAEAGLCDPAVERRD